MKHQMKKLLCIVLALLLAVLTACAKNAPETAAAEQSSDAAPAQSAQTPAEPAPEPEAETETVAEEEPFNPMDIPFDEGSVFMNNGLKLTVPNDYASLVLVSQGTTLFGKDNLFSARELASVEAGEKIHPGEDWGDGALFGIGRLAPEEAHEVLCSEIENVQIIGRDPEDNYYFCFYPTDVRLMREDMSNLMGTPDLEQWAALNDWAAAVPAQFLKDNPQLQPWPYHDSEATIYLARIAYMQQAYSLIYDFQEYAPKGQEGAEFAADLVENVGYELCIDEEAPDGEYQVVYLPQENIRFFFYKGGDYVTVDHGGYGALYRIIAPRSGYCLDVLERWVEALEG